MGKNNDSNVISRAYIDSLTIEQRLIDAVLPSPKAKILGKEFATPIMNAAFSFLAASHPGYPAEMAKGFRQADALNMWGMSNDEEMSAIYAAGADADLRLLTVLTTR